MTRRSRPQLLIVEDNQPMRRLLRTALEGEYKVLEAGQGQEAVKLALHNPPDGILLDLTLPDLSGLELCRIFSSLEVTKRVPILVVSAQPAAEYRDICVKLGARDYFEKPVEFDRLKACLDSALKSKPKERRTEPRARLSFVLRLGGVSAEGEGFELLTTTEDLSPRGFVCSAAVQLEKDSVVEVFLNNGSERYVGRARVIRVESPGKRWQRYAFQFIEEPRGWVNAAQ